MSANGEQPRTPLILTISTMHREVFISGTMALILQVTVMFRLRSLTQVTLLAYFATRNHRSHHLPATPSATQTMIQKNLDCPSMEGLPYEARIIMVLLRFQDITSRILPSSRSNSDQNMGSHV